MTSIFAVTPVFLVLYAVLLSQVLRPTVLESPRGIPGLHRQLHRLDILNSTDHPTGMNINK